MLVACEAADCSEIPHCITASGCCRCPFSQAASSTPITTHELFPLEQQIEVVEGKISMGNMGRYELRSTQPDGWQNEYGDLRGQEKQLRI